MKIKSLQYVYIIFSLFLATPLLARTTTTMAKGKCTTKAQVPYLKQLKAAKLANKTKEQMLHDWAYIYAAFLAKSATTKDDSKQWQALKQKVYIGNDFCKYSALGQPTQNIQNFNICLDAPTANETANVSACHTNVHNAYNALTTNYLQELHTYLSPTTFEQIKGDTNGYQYNYATHHLNKAVKRFSQTNQITIDNLEPQTHFTGDVRDLGIIVNITNHSDTRFAIAQTNHKDTFIGTVNYGYNGVNLHTAALQHHDTKKTKAETYSIDRFTFYPIDPMNNEPILGNPLFTIRMYTGSEIKKFLRTLPHDKKNNTFIMNGRPTSPEHLAKDKDWYMLIVQHPTPQGQQTPNPDQRIQAINISTLQGPFLLNMQINEMINTHTDPTTKQATTTKTFQPSFSTVQVIQSPTPSMPALPLFILPQYLWTNPIINLYWMMISTTYIAAITDFTFFGQNTFGSAFDYYDKLGYFESKTWYRFIFDKYNLLKIGQTLSDANWVQACALYETDLKNCEDVPSIYSAQNSQGNMIANEEEFYKTNLIVEFVPKSKQQATQDYFNKNGFNFTNNLPYHQLWTMIFSLPTDELKQSIFGKITLLKKNLYGLTWINKSDKFLNTQTLYLNFPFKDIKVNFLTNNPTWKGDTIPQQLLNFQSNKSQEFKIEYLPEKKPQQLKTSTVSPIDKIIDIISVNFSEYPLHNIYFDVYKTVNVKPYTRCHIIKNGSFPKILTSLTQQDWQNGIYLIPSITNNQNLNKQNPGALTITFYKKDKTLLGTTTTKGSLNNSNQQGIIEPVKGYNFGSTQFKTQYDFLLSTGILLKKTPTN